MPLWKIAWRSIQRRSLASALTMLSMALGVMLVVAVLLVVGVVDESFKSNSSLGYDTIVGPRGGELQLTLNTVYYLSKPVENVPFQYYEEFLPAAKRADGKDGKFFKYLNPDVPAVPVCLGDYFGEYRVIGTTSDLFNLVYDRKRNRSYVFADGANFTGKGEKGVFEAILGAKVARKTGLKVGEMIQPAHGAPDGKAHDDFQIVGILAPSGTPQDRGVFVNMDGFNSIAEHIRDDGEKEVTALLLDTKDPFRSIQLVSEINEAKQAMAVKPVATIYMLFSKIVGPIRNLLLVITGLICIVSGISILVSIYNSMSDRKHEIAIMRSLGAGRGTVMTVVLLESLMISLIGGVLGWFAGHALIGLASGKIEEESGVVVSAFDLAPKMPELSYLLGEALTPNISVEIWLIPILIALAIIVGFLPAVSAYRTDVAEALQSTP
jgi:putative ABC transport system permease protein